MLQLRTLPRFSGALNLERVVSLALCVRILPFSSTRDFKSQARDLLEARTSKLSMWVQGTVMAEISPTRIGPTTPPPVLTWVPRCCETSTRGLVHWQLLQCTKFLPVSFRCLFGVPVLFHRVPAPFSAFASRVLEFGFSVRRLRVRPFRTEEFQRRTAPTPGTVPLQSKGAITHSGIEYFPEHS